ncbi:MAG: DNA-3-methyladenine glycosylase family protein [Steroidobacterales bacterium]
MTTPSALTHQARKHLNTDPIMAALIKAVGPCTFVPRMEREPFESLARAISHQQLNGTAAQRILARFIALNPGAPFPVPAQVLAAPDDRLRAVGFSFAKIAALKDLAAKTLDGVVPSGAELGALGDIEIIERLTTVRGIGRWTVEMMLIFQLGRRDVLPVDDFGVRNGFRLAYGLAGMPLPRALAKFGERWRPYRTMAAWYLWRAVDLSRTERLPARIGRRPRVAIAAKPAAPPKKPALRKRAARRSGARK